MFIELFILFLCLSWFIHYKRRQRLPPGPMSIPFLGTLDTLKSASPGKLLGEKYFQYGDMCSILMGPYVFIVINDLQLTKEMFNMDVFSGKFIMNAK